MTVRSQIGYAKTIRPKTIQPETNRVNQGFEVISWDLDQRASQKEAILDFSRPSKPTNNAFIAPFNGRPRAEHLNAHWFLSLEDARAWLHECFSALALNRLTADQGKASDVDGHVAPTLKQGGGSAHLWHLTAVSRNSRHDVLLLLDEASNRDVSEVGLETSTLRIMHWIASSLGFVGRYRGPVPGCPKLRQQTKECASWA